MESQDSENHFVRGFIELGTVVQSGQDEDFVFMYKSAPGVAVVGV